MEHLSHWLQKYDKFCTMVCACRKAQRVRGEGVGDIEGHMCIGLGDIAEFLVETGKDAKYCSNAGFVGYSVRTGEPLLIKDAYQDPRFDHRSDEKTHYRTTSVMTVPLMDSAGNVMGVFQAINKQGQNELGEAAVFSVQDLERLRLTAVYSAKTV